MRTFIRLAEVWVPSADGRLLEPAGGLYDAAPAFGALTRQMCFGRAEGLPGRVWDEGRPLLLSPLEGSYFRRVAAAREAGVTCALGWPVHVGERLTSVVVLLCGEAQQHVGALELWHNDPRITGDLTLDSGYYASLAPELESLSHDAWLPRGSGAPGLAWQREAAVFVERIDATPQFLRAHSAAEAGIVRALALPCRSRDDHSWVVDLLSSAVTPIARRVESWRPVAGGTQLQRAFGFCELRGPLPAGDGSRWPIASMGAIGQAAASGIAAAAAGGAASVAPAADDARDCGLRSLLVLPLTDDSSVSEVVVFYF